MLFNSMTKRLIAHPELQEGESVIHACYGLGAAIVSIANRTVLRSHHANHGHPLTWIVPHAPDAGMAAPIQRSGVIVLTNKRLLYFQKRFAVGTPKQLTASWPIKLIDDVSCEDGNLTVVFVDETLASLHVPASQKPEQFVAGFQSLGRASV